MVLRLIVGCFGLFLFVSLFPSKALWGEEIPLFSGEKVLVIGKRLPKSYARLTRMPMNVTVVTREEIEKMEVANLPELLSRLEGVTVTDSLGHGLEAKVELRGMGGEGKNTLVLIDGVRMNEPFDNTVAWKMVSLNQVERVEVVRGGFSSIYGEGALGGVVNIVTRQPEAGATHWESQLQLGNYGFQDYGLTSKGSWGGWDYALDHVYGKLAGYRQNSESENVGVNDKLRYRLSENTALTVGYQYDFNQAGIAGGITAEARAADPTQMNEFAKESDGFQDRLNRVTLNYETKWQHWLDVTVNGFTQVRDNFSVTTFSSGTSEVTLNHHGKGITTQLGLWGNAWGIPHRLTAGSEYAEYFIDNPSNFITTSGSFPTHKQLDRYQLGFFLEEELLFHFPMKLVMGLRDDHVSYDLRDVLDPTQNKTRRISDVTPRVGITYFPTPQHTFYFNLGRAFRAPDGNTLLFETPGLYTANPDIDPTRLTNAEIGWRWEGEGMRLKGDLYVANAEKEILFNPTTFQNENFDTKRQGVEFSWEGGKGSVCRPFLRYTYLDARFVSSSFSGNKLPLSPEHQYTVGLERDLGPGLLLYADCQGVANYFILNDFSNVTPGEDYAVVSTKLSWHVAPHRTFYLRGKNLTNTKYSSFSATNGTTVRYNPQPELQILVGVENTF